jgi:hypothetical protein
LAKSKAKLLQESVSKFTTPKYPKVQRSPESFAAKTAIAEEQLALLQARYNSLQPHEDRRLLRDAIDYWLRRYQGYAVEAEMGAHYYTAQAQVQGSKYFEHVVPLCRGRDMLIGQQLTPIQAMYIPTCFVTKEQNDAMNKAGRGSHSDDYWLFFSRYDCFTDTIMTHDGTVVDPLTWTLADHYKYFKIKV